MYIVAPTADASAKLVLNARWPPGVYVLGLQRQSLLWRCYITSNTSLTDVHPGRLSRTRQTVVLLVGRSERMASLCFVVVCLRWPGCTLGVANRYDRSIVLPSRARARLSFVDAPSYGWAFVGLLQKALALESKFGSGIKGKWRGGLHLPLLGFSLSSSHRLDRASSTGWAFTSLEKVQT